MFSPAMLCKTEPMSVKFGFGTRSGREHDREARLITAEYDTYYCLCVYVPSAGRNLVTMDKRLRWNKMFRYEVVEPVSCYKSKLFQELREEVGQEEARYYLR